MMQVVNSKLFLGTSYFIIVTETLLQLWVFHYSLAPMQGVLPWILIILTIIITILAIFYNKLLMDNIQNKCNAKSCG